MTARQVIITPLAESDIATIVDFIAQDNPARAVTFAQELRAKCLLLAENPERFPVAERLPVDGVRKMVHRSYLIFYRVYPNHVSVARILHGATDHETRLGLP